MNRQGGSTLFVGFRRCRFRVKMLLTTHYSLLTTNYLPLQDQDVAASFDKVERHLTTCLSHIQIWEGERKFAEEVRAIAGVDGYLWSPPYLLRATPYPQLKRRNCSKSTMCLIPTALLLHACPRAHLSCEYFALHISLGAGC